MNNKKWNISISSDQLSNNKKINKISKELNLELISTFLLFERGCSDIDSINKYLSKTDEFFLDPFKLNNICTAVNRILKAVESNERITIYGDYDADGITATAITFLYLKSINGNVDCYIPNRITDGYGMSISAINDIVEKGSKLIITVDNGINSIDEIAYAKNLGIDTIVTDHHECPETIPNAIAIINPLLPNSTYDFKGLAGVGVAFKLLCALDYVFNGSISMKDTVIKLADLYSDLLAIGTIADSMPMISENRLLVSKGINKINKNPNSGVDFLIRNITSKTKIQSIDSTFISYNIVPKINAAGRMYDPSIALKLFISTNSIDIAKYASLLDNLNKERQIEEQNVLEDAIKKINKTNLNDVIVLDDDNWHIGVLGIVASKIASKFNKPCLLVSYNNSDIGKGSGRSVEGVNLYELINKCSKYLIQYGGHEQAAGITINKKNFKDFQSAINIAYRNSNSNDNNSYIVQKCNCTINIHDVTEKLYREICLLEPFGTDNLIPKFCIRNLIVKKIIPLSAGKHSKYIFEETDGSANIEGLLFGTRKEDMCINEGDIVNVYGQINRNYYNNITKMQIILDDICYCDKICKMISDINNKINESIEKPCINDLDIPNAEEFKILYKYLHYRLLESNGYFTIFMLYCNLKNLCSITYGKIVIIIKIFEEMNIFNIELVDRSNDMFYYEEISKSKKVNLNDSILLKKILKK